MAARGEKFFSRKEAEKELEEIMNARRGHRLAYGSILENFRYVAARTSAADLDDIMRTWFRHESKAHRQHATTISRILGEKKLMLHLIERLADDEPAVRANAVRSLEEMGWARRNLDVLELLL